MAMMIVNTGAQKILQLLLNNPGINLTLRLYTNSHTPASTDTMFTEATGGGYSPISLAKSNWTIAQASSIWTATFAQQTFTVTGPLTTNPTAYGYYVTDADGAVWGEESFATAWTPFNNGDSKKVTPKIQASHGAPAA